MINMSNENEAQQLKLARQISTTTELKSKKDGTDLATTADKSGKSPTPASNSKSGATSRPHLKMHPDATTEYFINDFQIN